jgi:hypothetical protein
MSGSVLDLLSVGLQDQFIVDSRVVDFFWIRKCAWCEARIRNRNKYCSKCKNAWTKAKGGLYKKTNLSPDVINIILGYLQND